MCKICREQRETIEHWLSSKCRVKERKSLNRKEILSKNRKKE